MDIAVILDNIPRCSEIASSFCRCDVVTSPIHYTQGLILPIPSKKALIDEKACSIGL
jgi:hypothetical protein